MDYETARSVADTYGLIFLMAVFIGAIIYIFRRARPRNTSGLPGSPRMRPSILKTMTRVATGKHAATGRPAARRPKAGQTSDEPAREIR